MEGYYRIRNTAAKTYLTATDTPAYGTGYELSVAEKAGDNNQIWKLEETDTCIVQAEMENGTISPEAVSVSKGELVDFTASVKEGYEVVSVLVNGVALDKTSYIVSEDGVLTFTLSDIVENQYVTVIAREPGKEPEMTGLKVTPPSKTQYEIGEELDLEGFKVESVYDDGHAEDVTEKAELSEFDSAEAGEKEITVSYGGMTEVFTVTVVKKPDPQEPEEPGGSTDDPQKPGESPDDPQKPGESPDHPQTPGGSQGDSQTPGGSTVPPASNEARQKDKTGTAAQTGDKANIAICAGMLAASLAAVWIAVKKRNPIS